MDNAGYTESSTTPEKKDGSGWASFLLETLQTIVLAIVLYFLIDTVIARVRVENISMLPTLHEDQFLLVDKISYHFDKYNHGDIVVFHYPQNPHEDYIKRMIGLPGDHIQIVDQKVYVNGYELSEPYIAAEPDYEGEWDVPDDAFFVLGDNRNKSSDSHEWGFVPKQNLIGKAILVYWPFSDFQLLTRPDVVKAAMNE